MAKIWLCGWELHNFKIETGKSFITNREVLTEKPGNRDWGGLETQIQYTGVLGLPCIYGCVFIFLKKDRFVKKATTKKR